MALRVFGGVLALAERLVAHALDDLCAMPSGVVEVRVDIRYRHVDVLVHFARTRWPVFGALAAQHDGPVPNDELRVHDDSIPFDTEALLEPKRAAEPLDGLAGIGIDENRHDGRGR